MKQNDTAIKISENNRLLSMSNTFVRIDFDLRTTTFSGTDLHTGMAVFNNAEFILDGPASGKQWIPAAVKVSYEYSDIVDVFGQGVRLNLKYVPDSKYKPVRLLAVTLYRTQSFITFGFGVYNPYDRPIRVCRIDMLSGELMPGQELNSPQTLRGGAGAEANFVENGARIDAVNSAMLTGMIGNQRHTVVAGGLHYKEFIRKVSIQEEKNCKRLTLSAWDPYGKTIPGGSTYVSTDSMYLNICTPDPFVALEKYGMALRKANNANPNFYNFPTLCGWMVSTDDLGEGKKINNSPGLVEQAALAEKSGITKYTKVAFRLEPDFYCYENDGDTQQGWWNDKCWADYGALRKPYDTFTTFCGALLEHQGIPFTYFQASMPSNDFALEHPDWMLNNDISRLHAEHMHAHPLVRYDYTEPGFQKHVLDVWKKLRKAGLKGVKIDYPETAWAWHGGFEDTTYTTSSAYRKLYELCREGLGPEAFIHERILGEAIHENVPRTDINIGVVDLQRIWNDSSHFEPEMASRMGLRWYKSRVVFNYYPDGKSMISPENGEPLTKSQRRTFLTVIAMLSGRLELGTSFGSMSAEMLHDISRVFPAIPGTQSPRPVDMFTGKKHPEIYKYEVSSEWSQILVCNNIDAEKNIEVSFAGDSCEAGGLGLDPKKEYYIYEFWNDRFIGRFNGKTSFNCSLGAYEALIYSVREVREHPQIISTNRHIMQGMLEIKNLDWNSSLKTYSGTADVIADEPMRIIIALNNYSPLSCTANSGTAEIVQLDKDLICLVLRAAINSGIKWEIKFN